MAFALGSFAGGLFSGAQSTMHLYGMYHDIQNMQAQDKIADTDALARAQDSQNTSNANVPGYKAGGTDPSATEVNGSVTPSDQSSTNTQPGTSGTGEHEAYPGPVMTKAESDAAVKTATTGGPKLAGGDLPAPTSGTSTSTSTGTSTPATTPGATKPIDTKGHDEWVQKVNTGLKLADAVTKPFGGMQTMQAGSTPTSNMVGSSNPLATPGVAPTANPAPAAPAAAQPEMTDAQRRGKEPLPTFRQSPVTYDPAAAGTPMARGGVGGTGPGGMPTQDVPPEGYPASAPARIGARPSPYQAAPSLGPNLPSEQVAPAAPAAAPAGPAGPPLTTSPFRARRGGDVIQREAARPATTVGQTAEAAPEQAGPPIPPAQSPFRARRGGDVIQRGAAPAGPPPLQFEDPNAWQPASGTPPGPPQFEDPNAWQSVPGQPAQAPAQPPAQPPAQAGGWGSQLLSAINPMGSAQAAEPQPGGGQSPAPGFGPDGKPLPAGSWDASPTSGSPTSGPPISKDRQQASPVADPTPVAPGQTTPSAASEKPAASAVPTVSVGPYTLLEQRPDLKAKLDTIAKNRDVTPQEMAATWYAEGGLQEKVPNGAAGEVGVGQLTADTSRDLDAKIGKTRDPTKLDDNLDQMAQRIHEGNVLYGQGTPASAVYYMRGPAGAERLLPQLARDPVGTLKANPALAAGLAKRFPGMGFDQGGVFPTGGPVSVHAAVNEAATKGPDGFLNSIIATGPQPMGMTALWRSVESQMIHLALRKGDMQGVYHAQDYVFQMSHAGALSNMMAADQALLSGDGNSAIQYLAKAHAFIPDNSFAKFGVGSDGKVWAEQFNETTGKPLGQPIEITHEALATQMMRLHDPREYSKFVQEQQKVNSEISLNTSKGAYYQDLPDQRREAAQLRADSAAAANQTRQDKIASDKQIHDDANASREAIGRGHDQARRDAALQRQQTQDHADAATNDKYYGPASTDPDMGNVSSEDRGRLSMIHHDLIHIAQSDGSVPTNVQANAIAKQYLKGELTTRPAIGEDGKPTGQIGLFKKDAKTGEPTGDPLGHITEGLANRLGLAGAKPQAMNENGPPISPVGAGAGSQLAAMQGLNTNMTGQPLQRMQA